MKTKNVIFVVILSAFLSNCTSKGNKPEEFVPTFVGGDLIISEILVGNPYMNRAIEIANISDKDVELDKYTINVYRNFGPNPKVSETLYPKGTLKPSETYVIAYEFANQQILNKADLIVDNYLNDGTFPLTINDEKGNIVDYFGYVGYSFDCANMSDAVRKIEKLSPSEYHPYDWIRFPGNDYSHLGNLFCPKNDDIYKGPKLTNEDFNTDYADNETGLGLGGCVKVSLNYTIDGDTTKFNFGSALSQYGISGSNSVRYYGINTPEVAHGDTPADPYGPEAREFTNQLINNAKSFVVQSVKGYSLRETYGRLLGYVWIANTTNPKPEDYILLNHYIVQNGFARIGHVSRGNYNDEMTYMGISYLDYVFDAQQYAIENKLHIYEDGL